MSMTIAEPPGGSGKHRKFKSLKNNKDSYRDYIKNLPGTQISDRERYRVSGEFNAN